MKIKYLTWLSEKTEKHEDQIELPDNIITINELMDYLENNKPECSSIFKHRHTIYTAINGEIKPAEFKIKNSDDISFFSAVVGG